MARISRTDEVDNKVVVVVTCRVGKQVFVKAVLVQFNNSQLGVLPSWVVGRCKNKTRSLAVHPRTDLIPSPFSAPRDQDLGRAFRDLNCLRLPLRVLNPLRSLFSTLLNSFFHNPSYRLRRSTQNHPNSFSHTKTSQSISYYCIILHRAEIRRASWLFSARSLPPKGATTPRTHSSRTKQTAVFTTSYIHGQLGTKRLCTLHGHSHRPTQHFVATPLVAVDCYTQPTHRASLVNWDPSLLAAQLRTCILREQKPPTAMMAQTAPLAGMFELSTTLCVDHLCAAQFPICGGS